MDYDAIDAGLFGGAGISVPSSAVSGGGTTEGTPTAAPVAAAAAPAAPAAAPAVVVAAPVAAALPGVTPAAADPAAVAAAAPAVVAAPVTGAPNGPEATGPGAGERIIPGRIATGQFSPTTQRALKLMHELNDGRPEGTEGTTSLAQCLAMIAQADGGQTITAQPQAAAVVAAPQPSQLETLRGEIADLEATITAAGENQSLFTPELARAVTELSDKKARAQSLETQESQTIAAHVAQRNEVRNQVIAEFKGADDPATPLGARVATLIEEWKESNDPRLDLVSAPRLAVEQAAKDVAKQVSAQFGIDETLAYNALRVAPLQPAPTTPAAPSGPAQPPPVGGNRSVVAPGGAPAGSAPAPMTEAQVLAAAASDPNAIDALLWGDRSGGFRIGG